METAFTKGRWAVMPMEDDKDYIRVRGTHPGQKYRIANVPFVRIETEGISSLIAEAKANANLIASAPDIYAELDRLEVLANTVIYCYEKAPGNFARALKTMEDTLSFVRQALAKARGES